MMRLWILRPKDSAGESPWEPWFDKAFGFVIRAENEEEARRMANDNGGDECGPISHSVYRTGGNPWLDADYSTCEPLTDEGDAEVVIRDFASA